jgi:DNA-binding PadR family transcriptional regulator
MARKQIPDSTTANALLGLLSIRPWTAYELTQQMQRALRWAWPRSEAGIYAEIKKLEPAGLATAVEEEVGNRTRTRYEITEAGREAARAWLRTEPAEPRVELEILLRLFLADLGAQDDLRRALDVTRRQVAEQLRSLGEMLEQYAGDGAPFPDRAHLNVLFMHFSATRLTHLLDWCDTVEAELDTWSTTAGVGTTARIRKLLDRTRDQHRDAVARAGTVEDGR